jgi:hypothetical protein
MATKDTIEIDVNVGEGVKSMKTLKKEFAEMQNELDGLIPGTQKYIETLQKLGNVKDEIGDLKAEIQAFAGTDAKVAAFGNVIGGVASGFQAAQGAAALLGAESEEVQKALLKVQAASALADGIKGITAMGDSLKVASNVAKQLITQILGVETVTKIAAVAQRVWNAVMAANPVLLIVAALAALVGGIALVVSAMEDENEAQKKIIATRDEEIKQLKRHQDALENFQAFEKNLAASRKLSADDMANLDKKQYDEKIKSLRELQDQTQKQIDEVGILQRKSSGDEYKELKEKNEKLIEEEEGYHKQILSLIQSRVIADAKAKSDAEEKAAKDKETKDKANAATAKAAAEKRKQDNANFLAESNKLEWEAWQAKNKAEQDAADAAAQKEIDDFEYNLKLKEDIEEDARLRKVAKKNREDEKRKQDEEADNAKGQQAAEKSVEALQGISDAFFAHKLKSAKGNEAETLKIQKKAFEVNKAFSVARAIQDGILSVSGALANTGTLGPGAIALAAVNGVIAAANVAKILASTFDGGSASNSSSVNVSTPGTFTQAPNVGSGGGNNQTQLNADGTVNKQGQPSVIKAYVVESESAEVSKRVNKLSEQSKI